MSKLMDKAARLAAMENLAKHFLSQAYEGGSTAEERKERHDAMENEVSPCGPFDEHDVVWLFYLLEERALTEITKFAALAQTTDPDAMLKYGIPPELVKNSKLLKKHHGREAKSASAGAARAAKSSAKDKEAFQAWVREAVEPNEHSRKIQIEDVRGMTGFKSSWGQNDATLKRWLREAIPGFEFKRGAKKK